MRAAICIPCTHKAVDEFFGYTGVDVEHQPHAVTSEPLREGEALQIAIDDANRKARDARKRATARRETRASEPPSTSPKPRSGKASPPTCSPCPTRRVLPRASLKFSSPPKSEDGALPAFERRPRGFWTNAVVETMRSFPATVVGPTKSEVYRVMRKRFPDERHHTVYIAVRRAIAEGVVVFRSPNIFLPENDPQKKQAVA